MNPHDQRIIHSSEDPNWRTPRACYDALDREFFFEIDLAADAESCLHPDCWLGPGSPLGENALVADWMAVASKLSVLPSGFLNMPFSRMLAAAYRTGRIKREGVWVEHPIDLLKAQSYEIESWVQKCWEESQRGFTVAALVPFAPQTEWYRRYVYGHAPIEQQEGGYTGWSGHAAREERRLPHRISFLRPDGSPAANAGVNTAIIVWKPGTGIVGPWQPHQFYWSYR